MPRHLRRSPWFGPLLVGLCAFLLVGATIRKTYLIAGSTIVSGATVNTVLRTNAAGILADTSPAITW